MNNFMIVDGNGNQITDGVSEHEVYRMAQSIANKRGESVWAHSNDQEDASCESGIEFTPNSEA